MKNITIRQAHAKDIPALDYVAKDMGARHEENYFAKCLAEQEAGNRLIFVAEHESKIIGYVQLNWRPLYAPFRRLDIPEIQDLNVIPVHRRRGVGAALVDCCEKLAKEKGKTDIGIGVGLYPRYGAAMRLYVQKGYIPDGAGITYDEVTVHANEMRPIDDLLTLKLMRPL